MREQAARYFEHPRKLRSVRPLKDYRLLLVFDNGEQRVCSMQQELTGVFSVLKDENKFNQVFLNEVGNVAWDIDDTVDSSIHWDNRIDRGCALHGQHSVL